MELFFGFEGNFLTLVAAAVLFVAPGLDVVDFFDTAFFDTAFVDAAFFDGGFLDAAFFDGDFLDFLAAAVFLTALTPFDDVFFVTFRFLGAVLAEEAAFFAVAFFAPETFFRAATMYSRCLCR